VLALILSLTVTGPLYAVTPHEVNASESCTNQNGEISMAWIFCTESQRNKQKFSDIYNDTDNTNSDSNSDSEPDNKQSAEHATEPPQPAFKPPKVIKAIKDDAHRHGPGHFISDQKPHSQSTSAGSKTGKGRSGRNPKANGRKNEQHHHHPAPVKQGEQTPRKPRGRRVRPAPLTTAEIRALIYPGIDLSDLTKSQRAELKRLFKMLLNKRTTKAVLAAIQKGEGGGLLTIVGGTRRKDRGCRNRIAALDTSGHPKEQGLPNRCFLRTRRYGLSTAAGLYQIVYYINWRHLRRLLDLKDFSAESQGIVALELMRSSKTPGSNVGDGLVALIKNDWANAIRKGTDPWASSPYSRWRGKNTRPYLAYAREFLQKLGQRELVTTPTTAVPREFYQQLARNRKP